MSGAAWQTSVTERLTLRLGFHRIDDLIGKNDRIKAAAKDLIAGANVLLQVVLQRAQRMD